MNLVLDANALIAYLEDEVGGSLVGSLLTDAENTCFVHSVNLCEVYYGARRGHGEEAAQQALLVLHDAGLLVREDMDDDFWQAAGRIKADYKRISLADCFCAALADRVGGEVVTADKEFVPLADAGHKINFIR